MKNRNFVYDGWKANGFVALACELVLLAGFIALIVWGALRADALQPLRRIALKGGILGEQRRAEGAQHHDHEQDQRGKGRRVTEKGPHKAAARLPAEMELLRIRRSSGANG